MNKIFLIAIIFTSISSYSQNPSWKTLPNSPIPDSTNSGRFEDVYFVNSMTGWVVEYAGKIYKTTDGGYNWVNQFTSPLFPDAAFRSLGFTNALTGWIGTLDSTHQLYGTTNGGLNWTLVTTFTGYTTKGVCGFWVINDSVIYGCGRWDGKASIIKTTNGGINWTGIDMRPFCSRLIDCRFTSNDSGIVVGAKGNGSNDSAAILFTSNGGLNWITRISIPNSGAWWCWKISFPTQDTGYVSIEGGISPKFFKTVDRGVSWVARNSFNGFEQGIGFVNGRTGWLGGHSSSLYETSNGGDNWHIVNWGSGLNRFRFVSDTLGYAVGRRVYKYTREPIGIKQISSEVPNSFSLEQNYPNPFNPVTNIKFSIPKAANVKLTIYDVVGREVTILVNEKLNAGTYNADWNGANFSSGIYYYKLETEYFSQTKKMVMIK